MSVNVTDNYLKILPIECNVKTNILATFLLFVNDINLKRSYFYDNK